MTNQNRAERRARLAQAGAIEVPADGTTQVAYLEGDPYQPSVPTRVRDAAYIGGLIVAGAVAITVPTISALVPDAAGVAAQIGVAVSSGVGIIVSGLGVVYRPGAST